MPTTEFTEAWVNALRRCQLIIIGYGPGGGGYMVHGCRAVVPLPCGDDGSSVYRVIHRPIPANTEFYSQALHSQTVGRSHTFFPLLTTESSRRLVVVVATHCALRAAVYTITLHPSFIRAWWDRKFKCYRDAGSKRRRWMSRGKAAQYTYKEQSRYRSMHLG